jgi:DNA polymerase-1
LELYPRIRLWQQQLREGRPREAWSLGGRRMMIEESAPDPLRFNAPVQMSAADGLKTVLGQLWAKRETCPGAVPVLVVHDELVLEVDEDQATAAATWLGTAMIAGMTALLEPIAPAVEIAVGRNWGDGPDED